MASPGTSHNRSVELTVIAVGGLALVWVVANELIALIAGGHHFLPGLHSALHAAGRLLVTGSPVAGWSSRDRNDLPSAPVWWVAFALLIGIGIVGWRGLAKLAKSGDTAWDPSERSPSAQQVDDTLGPKAVLKRAATLRIDQAAGKKPHEVGFLLGRSVEHGTDLYLAPDDSLLVVGPPGSGKTTSVVVPLVVDAPGPVVTTSTRDEVMRLSWEHRAGPCFAFAPLDANATLPRGVEPAHWSPLEGCEDPQTAILRAAALVKAGAGFGTGTTTNGDFWQANAIAVLRSLLHAAALSGRGIEHVVLWSKSPEAAQKEAVEVLAKHTPAWAAELASVLKGSHQLLSSILVGVSRALDAFADPHVLRYCATTTFSTEDLLKANGALFLWGSGPRQGVIAPLISSLVEHVVEQARQPQGRGKLRTHMSLVLDEAANIAPLPTLPQLLSDGGGSGIQVTTVFQSLAQGRHRWSPAELDAMWDASTLKLVLPGLGNADDLEQLSRLAGQVRVEREARSDSGSASTTTTTEESEPIWPPARIRGLPQGHALLFPRRLRPFEIETVTYFDRGWSR